MTAHMHAQATYDTAPASARTLQRVCACGESSGISGKCPACAANERLGVQPKFRINPLGDRWEQEADRIADQFVSERPMPVSAPLPVNPLLQRQAVEEGENDPHAAKPASAAETAAEAVAHGGRPLAPAHRSFFESRLGRDLSLVRIHDDARAGAAARGIRARAYTLGSHIAFAPGQFAPDTGAGRRLLAHELVHTIQQATPAHALFSGPTGASPVQRVSGVLQRDCAEDKRKCRSALNWSDGGHWIGSGPEPDCNCDNRLQEAQAACSNRMNWSDGGHWIGSGPEPNCNLSQTIERQSTLVYEFPSNECVQKYNTGRRRIATRISTIAGIMVGAVTLLITRNPNMAKSAQASFSVGGIAAGPQPTRRLGRFP